MTYDTAGCDPGKDGALVILSRGGQHVIAAYRTQEAFTSPTGRSSARDYRIDAMARTLRLHYKIHPFMLILEKQSARPGQGVTSMFSAGVGYGIWQGLAAALEIPIHLVAPATWTKAILKDAPGQGKARTVGVISRLLPQLELCPGRIKKPHEGICDAAALALWGWRTLGRGTIDEP